MTAPANATTTRSGRTYTNPLRNPSPEYLSVTTAISGGVPKHLGPWFKKVTAEYAVDNANTWINLERDAAVDLIKREADRVRDAAADRGTAVHHILEAAATGERPDRTWSPELTPYVDAGLRFLDDWQPNIIWSEVTVYSDRHLYAGTVDLVADLPGHGLVIIDYKTSKSIYAETGLQLAAYRHADYALINDVEYPIPEVTGGAAVHLRDDGTYQLIPLRCGHTEFQVFLAALEVARFTGGGYKAVKGPAVAAPTDVLEERRRWLTGRIAALKNTNPQLVEKLAAAWPTGVPTLKTGGHTHDQLNRVAGLLNELEAEHRAPFPDQPDPADQHTLNRAKRMVERITALPPDLLERVETAAGEHDIPNLRSNRVTAADLDTLEPFVYDAEREVADRRAVINLGFNVHFDSDPDCCLPIAALVGLTPGQPPTQQQTDHVVAVLNAVAADLLHHTCNPDGVWETTVPDHTARMLEQTLGGKRPALTVLKQLAAAHGLPSPRSFAAACGDPVLTALAVEKHTTGEETNE